MKKEELEQRFKAARQYAAVADHMDKLSTSVKIRMPKDRKRKDTPELNLGIQPEYDIALPTKLLSPAVPQHIATMLQHDLMNAFRTIEAKYHDIVEKIVEGKYSPAEGVEEEEETEKAPE